MATTFSERIVFKVSVGLAGGVKAAADAEETTFSERIRRAIRERLLQVQTTTVAAVVERPMAQ